jgi:putative flavoprotein involved in K+ transport
LLTPNWASGLPGLPYAGPDPDGFMTASDVVGLLERFWGSIGAPVRTGTNVSSLRHTADGYQLSTNHGDIQARAVVLASGACNRATTPAFGQAVPPNVQQVTPVQYHNPEDLPAGGVLVVGASATGVQLAAEIRRSGRPVTLSVGEHVRLPRTYRGRDVFWWMQNAGVWDQRYQDIEDLTRARQLPSPQLVGTRERTTLDLNTLMELGVEVVGRWASVRDGVALFSGGLRNVVSLADLKLERLLDTFDAWADVGGSGEPLNPPERFGPTRAPKSPRWQIDLRSDEFGAVVWATGFRPDYSWLDVPVLDEKGRLRHVGGVVDSPGLYALGLPVLRRRKSTFIYGIEDDAREIIDTLAANLSAPWTRRSTQPRLPSPPSNPGAPSPLGASDSAASPRY